jgi:hypothetical protein
MNALFSVHLLNEQGKQKAGQLAHAFDDLLDVVEKVVGIGPTGSTREMAIVRTKLEEACFFAKKAMAVQPINQEAAQ